MANKQRLGVNIDHVATLRNARGGAYPDPVRAALMAEAVGADGITAHLREDRRHIQDKDIYALMEALIRRPSLRPSDWVNLISFRRAARLSTNNHAPGQIHELL